MSLGLHITQNRIPYSILVLVSQKLKGGSSQLQTVLRHAVSLVAPPLLLPLLLKQLDNSVHSAMPCASTVHNYEFIFELAMIHHRQQHHIDDCVRFLWSDSSLQLGYDLLWAQYHEIPRSQLVPVFKAVLDLCTLIERRCSNHDNYVASSRSEVVVEPSWKPLLQQLLQVREHIFPPGSEGHMGP